jgi:hypothetical protein
MTDTDTIRRRPDGSIDTAFYTERARHIRSCQTHALLHRRSDKKRKTPNLMQRIFG